MTDVVSFSGVSKRFGDFRAVDDLSFVLPRGSVTGFLGPNGAGKTTSLRMMLGILSPDAGMISVFGQHSVKDVRQRVGYLPEERGLYRRMRALDAIVYIATLKGLASREAKKRALALLDRFGLTPFGRVRIQGLSKGMSQKIQIISCLVPGPEFLILDEPFSGLDPVNQGDLEAMIAELAAQGTTVLFSTHTMEHAERLCDRLIIINQGRKLFEGGPDQARLLLPRRARIEAEGDLSFLSALSGVACVQPPAPGECMWEIELREGADGKALIGTCVKQGIVPTHFDIAQPSLREVFVVLVGEHANSSQAAA